MNKKKKKDKSVEKVYKKRIRNEVVPADTFIGELLASGKPKKYEPDFYMDSAIIDVPITIIGIAYHDEYENDFGGITKQFIFTAQRIEDKKVIKVMSNHVYVNTIIRHFQDVGTPLICVLKRLETKKGKIRYILSSPD